MRVDRASRVIAAPRERVFEAFVDRDAVARWLPPTGSRGVLNEFVPAPGGPFRMTLIFDEGGSTVGKASAKSDVVEGRFIAITPPELIKQEFAFVSDDPRFAGTMSMTWTFTDAVDGTLVAVAASNVPEGISPDDHRAGMESSLENLARFLPPAA